MNKRIRKVWDHGRMITFEIDGVKQPLTNELPPHLRKVTIAQKAKNFASAASRVMKAAVSRRPVVISHEEQARRLSICNACEFYTGKTCRKCGCVIKFKSMLATEHCPLTPPKW